MVVPGPPSSTSVDEVIDEILGGDLSEQQRQQMLDEVAYHYISNVREQAGDQLTPELAEQLNQLAVVPQAEKDALLRRTNRVARRVLRPLGYLQLQLQGLDPATVTPEAAREALTLPLTPEQAEALDAEARSLFESEWLPAMQTALEDIGEAPADADAAWAALGSSVMQRREPARPPPPPVAAVAVPSVLAGALIALAGSALARCLRRRRARHSGHNDHSCVDSSADVEPEEDEEVEEGEEEDEEFYIEDEPADLTHASDSL